MTNTQLPVMTENWWFEGGSQLPPQILGRSPRSLPLQSHPLPSDGRGAGGEGAS